MSGRPVLITGTKSNLPRYSYGMAEVLRTEKLLSRSSHLPFSILFASLAFLLVAFNPPSFLQDPGVLWLFTAIVGTVMFCTSLALNRNSWLIAPIIGTAATFVSALYSSTGYPVTPCWSVQTSQGYPFPWIRRNSFPVNDGCRVYYQQIPTGLPPFGVYRNPIMPAGFLTDIFFYNLLTLAILELLSALRQSRSTFRNGAKKHDSLIITDKSRLPKTVMGDAAFLVEMAMEPSRA